MNRLYGVCFFGIMSLLSNVLYSAALTPAQMRQAQILRNTIQNSLAVMKIDPVKHWPLMVNTEKMVQHLTNFNTQDPSLKMTESLELFDQEINNVKVAHAAKIAEKNKVLIKKDVKKSEEESLSDADKNLMLGQFNLIMDEINNSKQLLTDAQVQQYQNNALYEIKKVLIANPAAKTDILKQELKTAYAAALEPQKKFQVGGLFGMINVEYQDIRPWIASFNEAVDTVFSGEPIELNDLEKLDFEEFRDQFFEHIDELGKNSAWDADQHSVTPAWLEKSQQFYQVNNKVRPQGGNISLDNYIMRDLKSNAAKGDIKPEDEQEYARETLKKIQGK